jgi:putative aldouronate transport system substrate-binding protein
MASFVKGGGDKGSKNSIDAYQAVYDSIKLAIDTDFKSPPTDAMAKVATDMGKLENEAFNAIVVGNKPLDAFDEFVTEWKAAGGDVWTEGVNEWYKSAAK